MYLKSLVVFVLCTLFVVGFVVVLNYEAGVVGNQVQALPNAPTNCTPSDISCPQFIIVSASLRSKNTTDQLGIANPAYASLVLNVTGTSTINRFELFVGNISAQSVEGPFKSGQSQFQNLQLLATASVTPGKTYLLSVEGVASNGLYLLKSEEVTAQVQPAY